MKKNICLLSFLLLFFNCVCMDQRIPVFNNINEAATWVYSNIEYKYDIEVWGQKEYWQPSFTTIALMTGDCEDRAILLKDIVFEQFYVKMDLLDMGIHVAAIYNNEVYDSWHDTVKNVTFVKCMPLNQYLFETKYQFKKIIYFNEINAEILRRNIPRVK